MKAAVALAVLLAIAAGGAILLSRDRSPSGTTAQRHVGQSAELLAAPTPSTSTARGPGAPTSRPVPGIVARRAALTTRAALPIPPSPVDGVVLLPPGADPTLAARRGPGIYVPEDAVTASDLPRVTRELGAMRDDFQTDAAAVASGRGSPARLSSDLRHDGDALRSQLEGEVVVETPQARLVIAPDHEALTAP